MSEQGLIPVGFEEHSLTGGSESVTSLCRAVDGSLFVRKIARENASSVAWPGDAPHSVGLVRRLRAQAEYLLGLPHDAAALFPRVLGSIGGKEEFLLYLEYINSPSLSTVAVEDLSAWREGMQLTADMLRNRVHNHWRVRGGEFLMFENWHVGKMKSRYALCQEASLVPVDESMSRVIVNGRQLMTLEAALQELSRYRELLSPPWLCMTVGDTNTQNVLMDVNGARGVRFLDPRGLGVVVGTHTVDDPLYDWKFWHNTLGHYDAMFDLDFRIRRGTNGSVVVEYGTGEWGKQWDAAFSLFMEDPIVTGEFDSDFWGPHALERFFFLMGSHFIAMMPFHLTRNDERSGRASDAMYFEGLFWLNACLDIIKGGTVSDHLKDYWRE